MSGIDLVLLSHFTTKRKPLNPYSGSSESGLPWDKYEIICVNNNSADNSCSIISKYPSVKLIQEKTQGAYIARNAGILASHGDFLVFSDADAVTPRNWLSNIHGAISKENFDIVIGWYLPVSAARLLKAHTSCL